MDLTGAKELSAADLTAINARIQELELSENSQHAEEPGNPATDLGTAGLSGGENAEAEAEVTATDETVTEEPAPQEDILAELEANDKPKPKPKPTPKKTEQENIAALHSTYQKKLADQQREIEAYKAALGYEQQAQSALTEAASFRQKLDEEIDPQKQRELMIQMTRREVQAENLKQQAAANRTETLMRKIAADEGLALEDIPNSRSARSEAEFRLMVKARKAEKLTEQLAAISARVEAMEKQVTQQTARARVESVPVVDQGRPQSASAPRSADEADRIWARLNAGGLTPAQERALQKRLEALS